MCSTIIFGKNDQKILAENYDFSHDFGLVATNLRGTKKSNGQPNPTDTVRWTVQYGSITFNQFSLEMPVSGMNEVGLAVALMWHEEGDFGSDDGFRRLSGLQWIQYQLDNFKTIAEVEEGLQSIRPERGPVPLHFTVLDAQGDSALIEFLGDELVLHRNVEFPILTNNSYASCLAIAEAEQGKASQSATNSVGRFVHLFDTFSSNKEIYDAAEDGFQYLDSVRQSTDNDERFPWSSPDNETITAWSIVFDPTNMTILYKTSQNQTIRKLCMADFDFAERAMYQNLDVHANVANPVAASFSTYTKESNFNLLQQSSPTMGLPDEVVHQLTNVVDSLYLTRQMN